ncbi:MAG: hypothetical protein AB7V14_06320 [Kiritimatiellia bacterium]
MKTMHPSVLTVAAVSLLAAAIAALLEIGAAICASATMFTLYGMFWTGVLAPFLLRHPARTKYLIYLGLMACLAILYLVPWNTRKPFLRDLEKVQMGMTVDQVEEIMGRYKKGTGWPVMPGTTSPTGQLADAASGIAMATSNSLSGELVIRDSMTYRHSEKGAFNSDWGVVRFSNGMVAAKVFMPD